MQTIFRGRRIIPLSPCCTQGLSKLQTLTFNWSGLHYFLRPGLRPKISQTLSVNVMIEGQTDWFHCVGHKETFTTWEMMAGMNIGLTIKYDWSWWLFEAITYGGVLDVPTEHFTGYHQFRYLMDGARRRFYIIPHENTHILISGSKNYFWNSLKK